MTTYFGRVARLQIQVPGQLVESVTEASAVVASWTCHDVTTSPSETTRRRLSGTTCPCITSPGPSW